MGREQIQFRLHKIGTTSSSFPADGHGTTLKSHRQTESGRTLTVRLSPAFEWSVKILGDLNRFYVATTLALGSAVVHKHTS